jgi:serine/threonine protein kinase
MSPTLTSYGEAGGTQLGVILGTAAYMAPEQARGKPVDKRADVWAFGVVLYEMLTGRAAFAGDTITDIIAAVVTREPDWTAVPATTPGSIRRLLARCLEKDPKRRLRDIGDARLEFEEMSARGSVEAPTGDRISGPTPDSGATRIHKLPWTLAGVALAAVAIAAASVAGVWPRARPSGTRLLRVSILHTEGSEVGTPAISPDGRRVA